MGLRVAFPFACAVVGLVSPQMAVAYSASGQDAGGAQNPNADIANLEGDAGEIIVTARRRDEALQDVPISVSVLSGDRLIQAGVNDVQGLQYATPSLSITGAQTQRNTVAFAMRGQRTQETQLFTDPPVGTYFAEVVQPRPYGFGKSFFDLQSVQVLKGVQGTLFGRNMTGGAVLVEPQHPKLDTLEGEIRGQYGNYSMWDLYGLINVPLGDGVALRVAGRSHERDGWARDASSGRRFDNQNYDTFRVSALVVPADAIESLTIFDWYKSKENGTASYLTAIRLPSVISNYENLRQAGRITADIPAQFAAARQAFRERRFTLDTGAGEGGNLDYFGAPYENIRNWGVTNKMTWELNDELTIKNIFGYRKVRRDIVQDYDGIPAFLITPYQFSRSTNISEELQLQGKVLDGKLDFIVGAFYFEEKGIDGSIANTLPELNLVGAGLDPKTADAGIVANTNPGKGYARTAAAFIAGTLHVTDKFSLSGGLRYNYDKRRITVSPSQPNRPNPDGTIGQCNFDVDAAVAGVQTVPFSECSFSNSKAFNEWTYDATAQWEPSNEVTAYAAYRHGFRAGGFSTRANSYVALEPFLPEFVNEYELGVKTNTSLGTGRLTTSLALFRQDGSDVQKQRGTFVNGNVFTIVDNTAKQRNTGGEFEATLSVQDFWITAFYSYTKVKILEGAVTSAIGPEIAQRGIPRHQAGITATLSPPIAESIGDFDLTANWTWRSKTYLDDFEIEGLQPAYSLVNLRAELREIGGTRFSAALFANNLLDETYRIGTLGLIAEGLGFQASAYGEPRMYGVEVGFKF